MTLLPLNERAAAAPERCRRPTVAEGTQGLRGVREHRDPWSREATSPIPSWSTTLPSRSTGTTAETGFDREPAGPEGLGQQVHDQCCRSRRSRRRPARRRCRVIALAVAAKVIVEVSTDDVPGPTP